MLLVRRSMGSPLFFRQQRPGKDGKPFGMVKFRTMSDARDTDGKLLPDAERLTRLGQFMRATSLDELPELWNVRSEEHTSELQSLMRITYAVFCLKKKKTHIA